MRAVESFTSDSSDRVESVPATQSSPGSRVSGDRIVATATHQSTSTPAAASGGAMRQALTTPRCFEPVGDRLLPIDHVQGLDGDGRAVEVTPHPVEGDELLTAERALRQVGE